MLRNGKRRLFCAEQLESRRLLAAGPLVHTHNSTQLAVVDAGTGDIDTIATLSGFAEGDSRLSDIAFAPDSRLYGITSDYLYEVHPATAELTLLGRHEIPSANALVFDSAGVLYAMGPSDGRFFRLTFNETELTDVRVSATLSQLDPGVGSGGDIAFMNGDLVLASSDNRLLWYRFDVNPDRPRIVREIELSELGVDNVFGLAVVDNQQLVATGRRTVTQFDFSNPGSPRADVVSVSEQTFGDLRGAAQFGEAGGGVPVGTMAGTKWHDVNGDGTQQLFEPALEDWPLYIDLNLNGVFDDGEPTQQTDEQGRYYFFGFVAGLYTVDEVISDPTVWEQSYPLTPHRNLVGVYRFEGPVADNTLFHDFGLPEMIASAVNMPGNGSVSMVSAVSHLELPVALGDDPFTIVMDATYRTDIFTDKYLVSQRANADEVDFSLLAAADTRDVTAEFCTQADACGSAVSAPVESVRQSYGITWDGVNVGAFSDDALVINSVSGTLDRLQGDAVRFGNPTAAVSPTGAQGAIHEIRIYNTALSELELDRAFFSLPRPGAYSVYVDDTRGVDGPGFWQSRAGRSHRRSRD